MPPEALLLGAYNVCSGRHLGETRARLRLSGLKGRTVASRPARAGRPGGEEVRGAEALERLDLR
jgi:hypothetical protein